MKRIQFCFLFILMVSVSSGQHPPFWNDIQAFKIKDSTSRPVAHQVLFAGSSSFTFWTDVQDYFPSVPILNRGFGGSSLLDLIRYKEEVLFAYNPKQIVLYCGENDFAANDTVSVETVITRFKMLFAIVRSRYKNIPFAYVSMKPSPSRQHLMPKFDAANNQIKIFLSKYRKTAFIDVYHKMLNPDGSPMAELFGPDKLHMNAKGYAIWQKEIEPHLLK